MKRSIINIIKIFLLIIGFVSALWLFMPWKEAGTFAMSAAYSQLGQRGMRLSYSDVSGEADGFTVHNLALNGMANISFSSITIRPRIIASILSFAPVCDIAFNGLSVQFGNVLNFGNGSLLLTAGRNEILLENVRTTGDFALSGYITIDLANMKIGRADARVNVPENFNANMMMLRKFLPLEQEGGRWYLRRK